MNDPDDLYYCTYGELVNGQKYRYFSDGRWSICGVSPERLATGFVQAQRWVEPPPPPVMVEVEADVLAGALWRWFYDERVTSVNRHDSHRRPLWDAIYEAREEAQQ